MTSKNDELDLFEKIGYVFSLASQTWQAFKVNWLVFVVLWFLPWLMITALAIAYIIPTVTQGLDFWTIKQILIASSLLVVVLLLNLILVPATIYTQLNSVKAKKISIIEALSSSKSFVFPYLGAAFILAFVSIAPYLIVIPLMLILIGFLLLPFALAFSLLVTVVSYLVPYILIDQKLSPIKAIKQTIDLVKLHWQWVAAIFTVLIAIQIISSATSAIGLGLFSPLVAVALSAVYYCLPAYIYLNYIKPQPEPVAPAETKSAKKSPAKKSK